MVDNLQIVKNNDSSKMWFCGHLTALLSLWGSSFSSQCLCYISKDDWSSLRCRLENLLSISLSLSFGKNEFKITDLCSEYWKAYFSCVWVAQGSYYILHWIMMVHLQSSLWWSFLKGGVAEFRWEVPKTSVSYATPDFSMLWFFSNSVVA